MADEILSEDGRREQVIWAAGFFDGEGCVSIVRHRPRAEGWQPTYYLEIKVFQKFPDAIRILQSLFGGKVSARKHGKCDGWLWCASGHSMIRVLQELEPFLVVKKRQAQLGITFHTRKGRRGVKYKDPELMRGLNLVDFERMKSLKMEA